MSITPRIISDDSIPRLPRGVRLVDSEAQGGTVLLAPERIFKPDPIAVEILKRCNGVATVAAIANDLASAYSAPRALILGDIKTLLGSLADKQLLDF